MQLREFLPRVLNGDLIEMLHKARAEKLLLREQLWQSGAELQQQADFCSGLGSAACSLLWSCSSSEDTVTRWLGKLQSFLAVAAQTLESFVRSLDEEAKTQTEDHNSQEHQFVLAMAGTITNVAAVTRGRDFLSSSVLLDTLMKLLELMKPGVFPKLKVLMLMALYNVSISVKGLKGISENPGLLPLIWTLLDDGDWEVCLHSLRLLQSVLLEEEVLLLLGSALLDPDLHARVSRLTSSVQPSLRLAAQQTMEDLQALQQVPLSQHLFNPLNPKTKLKTCFFLD
uniref:Heat shock transcription factor 2 binding protein n=1 Tax=Sander lucioperca TaxID=283035 RepID=A0A8C9XX21_SANLU